MFVPLSDDNPLVHIEQHYVTLGLVAANVVVYLVFQSGIVLPFYGASVVGFGLIPGELFDLLPVPAAGPVPENLTLVSYMFLHGDWLHLLSNLMFLWVFGDNVEDAMGHLKFLLFYLACGMAAGLTHAAMNPTLEYPLVGASGAVAGVIAAYLMLHPRVRIWVLVLWRLPLRLPAVWVLGFWILLQVFSAVTDTGGPVAWWAHIGGLLAGALLVVVMRRAGVPLFDRRPL